MTSSDFPEPDKTASQEYRAIYTELKQMEHRLDIAINALEQIRDVGNMPTKTTAKDIASWTLERIGE